MYIYIYTFYRGRKLSDKGEKEIPSIVKCWCFLLLQSKLTYRSLLKVSHLFDSRKEKNIITSFRNLPTKSSISFELLFDENRALNHDLKAARAVQAPINQPAERLSWTSVTISMRKRIFSPRQRIVNQAGRVTTASKRFETQTTGH